MRWALSYHSSSPHKHDDSADDGKDQKDGENRHGLSLFLLQCEANRKPRLTHVFDKFGGIDPACPQGRKRRR